MKPDLCLNALRMIYNTILCIFKLVEMFILFSFLKVGKIYALYFIIFFFKTKIKNIIVLT